jgi:predicted phage terminase large subunit-like protein
MGDRALARYAELLRNDFVAFTHRSYLELYPAKSFEANWHIDVIAEKLEAVRNGKINRLIINIPPRSLKSILGSVVFPAFVLGHNPSVEVLCTTYGQDIANDLALPCRSLMQSRFYQALFPTRLSEERQAVEEFKTTAGGARRAVSWGGAILGRGADFIVIDDPIKPEDANSEARRNAVNEAFHTSIAPRLNKESAAIILIMQRLHANDLSAFVQKSEHWEVLAVPALAERDEVYKIRTPYGGRTVRRPEGQALQPKRFSASFLKGKREGQGARTFDAQYQQKPHGAESAIIQREWLAWYDDNTKPSEFNTILQSWDTATKPAEGNSYNVCTTWGIRENRFYLLDVLRERLGFRELKLKAISLANIHKPTTIVIEEQSSGSPLMSELEAKGFPVQPIPPGSASKAERLYARSNIFENGRVLLPRKASWLDVYVDEITTFPDSDFSDQVDSTTQALSWDTSSSRFTNALRTIELLNGSPFGDEARETIKLRVLPGGGGGTLQFNDDSGRPNINLPGPGEVFEIDKDLGVNLVSTRWREFQIVHD